MIDQPMIRLPQNYFNQSIVVAGNSMIEEDKLQLIGDRFKETIRREGGSPDSVSVQRGGAGHQPSPVFIDVFFEFAATTPDNGFRFSGEREVRLHTDNVHHALAIREAMLGRVLNHTLRGLVGVVNRINSGDYEVEGMSHAEYIAQTLDTIIGTFPNTTTSLLE